MRGSVFRIVFRTFLREFEYIETSPGFAQLLGEELDFQNDVGKKSLNGWMPLGLKKFKLWKSRNECCDFTKFSHQNKMLQIHTKKVNEKPQNWQCAIQEL